MAVSPTPPRPPGHCQLHRDVLDEYPGKRIARTCEEDAHLLVCRFTYQLIKADGAKLPECAAFIEFTEDS